MIFKRFRGQIRRTYTVQYKVVNQLKCLNDKLMHE